MFCLQIIQIIYNNSMDPIFFEQAFYNTHKIHPENLRTKINQKYKDYDLNAEYSFEELLFILDELCEHNRCDRDVAKELFEESASPENKATINQMIFNYISNLQTSKLCLMRQSKAISNINQKISNLKGSKNCYVHLKIIQVTVYARYSSIPSLSYKISPSDIPPVTVINTLNPELNHQYTLQMVNNQFQIIFYESGLEIGRWKWPDPQYHANGQQQFQHYRNITLQNLSFELQLKYIPKNSDPKSVGYRQQLKQRNTRRQNENEAFKRLCYFQPFLDQDKVDKQVNPDHGKTWEFTQRIIECLPFVSEHVRNLYYCLIVLILIESLASILWSMEFLDIGVCFYLISSLYDLGEPDLGMEFWGSTMGFILLIVKSIWGVSSTSDKGHYFVIFLVMAIIGKLICILFLWISAIRKEQIPRQRIQYFYEGVDPKKAKQNQQNPQKENLQIFIDA